MNLNNSSPECTWHLWCANSSWSLNSVCIGIGEQVYSILLLTIFFIEVQWCAFFYLVFIQSFDNAFVFTNLYIVSCHCNLICLMYCVLCSYCHVYSDMFVLCIAGFCNWFHSLFWKGNKFSASFLDVCLLLFRVRVRCLNNLVIIIAFVNIHFISSLISVSPSLF